MMTWWDEAFVGSSRKTQFFSEAEAVLLMMGDTRSLKALFEGITQKRLWLKINQQLTRWHGLR